MMSSSYAAVLGKRSLDQWKVTELKEELKRRKLTIETFKSDGCKATEAYDAIASELDQSKARVNFLEELVIKLKADINKDSQNEGDLQTELNSIRSDLEAAEMRYNDEQIRTVEQLRQAFKIVEEIKSSSSHKESELMKSKYLIEELKANLMDKETELQGICEENEDLKTKLGIDLEATKAAEREAVRLEREESAQPVNEIDDEKGLLAIGKVDEVNAVQETNTGEQTSQLNEENGTNETREKATADSTIQLENVDDDSSCLQSDQVTQPLQVSSHRVRNFILFNYGDN
ncbi:hypothetical protein ACJIZ3_003499 [Penstemon smallii]|uniref:Uncharacterized protein n=1 Tax=Penstemon smallii TaxID=265156 RepID=A0ABD3U9H9_9LAMI